nr:hypothetical protein 8 [bacterium]
MREVLKTLRGKFKNTTDKFAKKLINKYLDFGVSLESFLEEKDIDPRTEPEEEEDKKPDLDLAPLREYMSDYIGMMVINIKGFDGVEFKSSDSVHCKIIADCKLTDNSIELHLADLRGAPSGYIKISPSKYGSFAERDPEDIPMWSSRYRISFYGGDALEYFDSRKQGSIEYFGD